MKMAFVLSVCRSGYAVVPSPLATRHRGSHRVTHPTPDTRELTRTGRWRQVESGEIIKT